MKKLVFLLFIAGMSFQAFAQDSGFGLGIIIGEPTGLSAKVWTTEQAALDAAMAWSFVGNGFLRFHSDLLLHRYLIDVDQGKLPVYFGLGAKLVFASDLELGIRIPLGIAYQFESAPFEAFLEVVPVFNLIPQTAVDMDGGIGIRYYF
ncbi:MAG: hypothetical protein ABFS28_09855 [Bacteroidota bacterium]